VAGLDSMVWLLENTAQGDRAEIWPAQGFSCYRWAVPLENRLHEILYADPQFLAGSSPTRTGIPILLPFPNRIRGGRFVWEGKEYVLPTNDPAKKNAIHGFACRRPWRVADHGSDAQSAWVTGEFRGSRDAADCRSLWPADYRIRLTYRLLAARLRMEAVVDNPDSRPLPFGLGYHHYFRVEPGEACRVMVPARNFWELEDNLPTGVRRPVDAARDLNQPRLFADLQLDDVLTDLGPAQSDKEGLCFRGRVQSTNTMVEMHTSPAFREAVVFTPPHRQAFCIEPYTCVTDAMNLQSRGVDAGLLVLKEGEAWRGIVEMVFGRET
jgi:aldose 1-epimerase